MICGCDGCHACDRTPRAQVMLDKAEELEGERRSCGAAHQHVSGYCPWCLEAHAWGPAAVTLEVRRGPLPGGVHSPGAVLDVEGYEALLRLQLRKTRTFQTQQARGRRGRR